MNMPDASGGLGLIEATSNVAGAGVWASAPAARPIERRARVTLCGTTEVQTLLIPASVEANYGLYVRLSRPMVLPSGSANHAKKPVGILIAGTRTLPPSDTALSRYG